MQEQEKESTKKIEVSGTAEELPWTLILAAAMGTTVVVNIKPAPKSPTVTPVENPTGK